MAVLYAVVIETMAAVLARKMMRAYGRVGQQFQNRKKEVLINGLR